MPPIQQSIHSQCVDNRKYNSYMANTIVTKFHNLELNMHNVSIAN